VTRSESSSPFPSSHRDSRRGPIATVWGTPSRSRRPLVTRSMTGWGGTRSSSKGPPDRVNELHRPGQHAHRPGLISGGAKPSLKHCGSGRYWSFRYCLFRYQAAMGIVATPCRGAESAKHGPVREVSCGRHSPIAAYFLQCPSGPAHQTTVASHSAEPPRRSRRSRVRPARTSPVLR
jgi:hypothetical protein